ncbi:3-keto-disaccharide hydrolase [Limnoglobus roseus]|uniref:Putative beta-jelly-roll-type glycoside hydrolase n=1 Tax=Limnoglobus roseus TaxID=2598579 RepID=A0A5C1AIW6_9BACT|nr:DUF1080 domain-containing protein [Limnoglobus roseus]QEL19101.1 putative beta-jelly-roll-type glycoside hydrolase [Limnoglobus roseus]
MRSLVLLVLLCTSFPILAAEPPKATPADGWTELLKSGPDTPWKKVDAGWVFAEGVVLDAENGKKLKPSGKGDVWVNGDKGRLPDLITKQDYKDVEVHVEFLIGKGSNAGVKFHAVYEIQILDTAAKKGELTGDFCGGIYPRAEDKPAYHHIDKGIGPKVNAAKPAGEWQTLEVTFTSPRLNDKGERMTKAKVVKATLNGQLIHENVELETPTGSNWKKKEVATGPFMLQSDHGPVAFRNVKIREIK